MLVTLALVPSIACAQSAPDPTRDAEARSLFQAGVAAFNAGRYEDALDRFEQAYEASPRPDLLYNLGSAADRLQREDAALSYFRAYLDQSPSPERRGEVEARIAALQRSVAEREQLLPRESEPIGTDLRYVETDALPGDADGSDDTLVWGLAIGGGAVVVIAAIIIGVVASAPQSQPLLDGDLGGVVFALGAW